MAKEINLSNLVINTYPSEEAYEKAKAQGLLKDDEMHLIEGDEIKEISSSELLEIWNSIMND